MLTPSTGTMPSLGISTIVVFNLQNGLRQQSASFLKRRYEPVQFDEAHARHRHGDAQASNQFSIR